MAQYAVMQGRVRLRSALNASQRLYLHCTVGGMHLLALQEPH